MTKTEEFFKENATKPTAWTQGSGWHVRFSMQKMLYDRDEAEIKKLVVQLKLHVIKGNSHVTFAR